MFRSSIGKPWGLTAEDLKGKKSNMRLFDEIQALIGSSEPATFADIPSGGRKEKPTGVFLSEELSRFFSGMRKKGEAIKAKAEAHNALHKEEKQDPATCEALHAEVEKELAKIEQLRDVFWACVQTEANLFAGEDVGITQQGEIVTYEEEESPILQGISILRIPVGGSGGLKEALAGLRG